MESSRTAKIVKLEPIQAEQAEQPGQEPDGPTEVGEIRAWQPIGDDLWLPHRIRGSWRGGVLG